jgi:hypothetical protein
MKRIMQKLEDILIAAAFSEAAVFEHALELLRRPSSAGSHETVSGPPLITEACP